MICTAALRVEEASARPRHGLGLRIYAATWCPACKATMRGLAADDSLRVLDVRIGQQTCFVPIEWVDVDDASDSRADESAGEGIPEIEVSNEGEVIGYVTGSRTPEQLRNLVRIAVSKNDVEVECD